MRESIELKKNDQTREIIRRLKSAILNKQLNADEIIKEASGYNKLPSWRRLFYKEELSANTLYILIKKYDLDAHYILTGEEYIEDDETERLRGLFTAFIKAREAFLNLDENGRDPDPQKKNLLALRAAGQSLHEGGEKAAMVAAYTSFFPGNNSKTDQVGNIVSTEWDRIGNWYR